MGLLSGYFLVLISLKAKFTNKPQFHSFSISTLWENFVTCSLKPNELVCSSLPCYSPLLIQMPLPLCRSKVYCPPHNEMLRQP